MGEISFSSKYVRFKHKTKLLFGCSKSNQKILQVLQSNAQRAVMKVDSCFAATEIHWTLEVDWLDTFRKHFTCCRVYKIVNGKGPPPLTNMFKETIPTCMYYAQMNWSDCSTHKRKLYLYKMISYSEASHIGRSFLWIFSMPLPLKRSSPVYKEESPCVRTYHLNKLHFLVNQQSDFNWNKKRGNCCSQIHHW